MRVFTEAFADVNEHFSNLVSSLFPGGMGRLTLTDPEQLLDTGVEVEARPAGRNVRRLSLLSGGERSLVAMAFLFAIFRSRPSPFYLMDEVEAALDDVNLQRFLGLVHEFRDEAQLIIVSHQKRTMEAADALYGVTMAPGGSSQVLSQRVPRTDDSPLPDGFGGGAGTFGNGSQGNGNDDQGTHEGASGPVPGARHGRSADGPPPRPVPSADEDETAVEPEAMEDAETRVAADGGRAAGHRPPVGVGGQGDCLGGDDGFGCRRRRVRGHPGGGGRRWGGRGPPATGTRPEVGRPTGRGGIRRRHGRRAGPERGGHPAGGGYAAGHARRSGRGSRGTPGRAHGPEELAPAPSYRSRLGKARGLLAGYLGSVRSRGKIDAETWDDLEEALIRADVGVGATDALLADLRQRVKGGEVAGADDLVAALKSDLVAMLSQARGARPRVPRRDRTT